MSRVRRLVAIVRKGRVGSLLAVLAVAVGLGFVLWSPAGASTGGSPGQPESPAPVLRGGQEAIDDQKDRDEERLKDAPKGDPLAFTDQSDDEAISTLRREVPMLFEGSGAPQLPDGAKVERYLGEHRAVIEKDGEKSVVESALPLKIPKSGEAGARTAPIDTDVKPADSGTAEPENTPAEMEIGTAPGDEGAPNNGATTFFTEGDFGVKPLIDGQPVDEGRSRIVEDKTILPNAGTDTDFATVATPTGTQSLFVLRSRRASEDFSLRVVGKIDELEQLDGGVGVALKRDGKVVGQMQPPFATDRNGRTVPLGWDIKGNDLEIVVNHRAHDLRYPLVVDPYVAEDQRYWVDGTSVDYTGWRPEVSKKSDGSGAPDAQANAAYAYESGAGTLLQGSGLSLYQMTGKPTPSNSFVEYVFRSAGNPSFPDENAHVFAADFGYTLHLPTYQVGSCMVLGIYDPRDDRFGVGVGAAETTFWKFGQQVNTTAGPYYSGNTARNGQSSAGYGYYKCDADGTYKPNASTYSYRKFSHSTSFGYEGGDPNLGRGGNQVVFGLTGGAGTAPTKRPDGTNSNGGIAFMGSSLIQQSEQAPPRASLAGVSAGWADSFSGQPTVTGTDYGLGMRSLAATLDGTSVFTAPAPACLSSTLNPSSGVTPNNGKGNQGDRNNRCPETLSGKTTTVNLTDEGEHVLSAKAVDLMANEKSTDAKIKIDRSPPTISAAESLKVVRFKADDEASKQIIKVPVSDQYSGVKTVTAMIDGNDATVKKQPTCTPEQCDKAFVAEIDASKLSDGLHLVKVTATDMVGAPTQRHRAEATLVYTVLRDASSTGMPGSDLGRKPVGNLGFENWFTFDSTDTGADSTLRANLATGNAVWSLTPVQNPGIGLNSFLRLTYNSYEPSGLLPNLLDTGNAGLGGYGVGGRGFSVQLAGITRLNEPLEIQGPGGIPLDPTADAKLTSRILFTDGDGTQHDFERTDDDKVLRFDAPDGVHLEMRRYNAADPNRFWAATRPDGTTFFFNRQGYATEISDRHANKIRFEYEQSKLKSVCGWRVLCDQRVKTVTDSAGIDPTDLSGASTRRAWTLKYDDKDSDPKHPEYNDGDHLVTIRDRKNVSGAARVTRLDYDTAGRLTNVTENADADDSQQRSFGLGYDGDSTYLTRVTDPRGNDTTVAYQDAQSTTGIPALEALLNGTGLLTKVRPIASIVDRASETRDPNGDGARTKRYRFDDPGSDKTRLTWVRNARNVVDQVKLDDRGRMIESNEATDDPTTTDETIAPAPRKTLQAWTGDNQVDWTTIGAASASTAVTTDYVWGEQLGELTEQKQYAGQYVTTAPGSARTSKWEYRRGPGKLQGENDGGKQFVYDLTKATDRRGKETSYEYADVDLGDVTAVKRQGAGTETYKYDRRGLVTEHATEIWGGSAAAKPDYSQAESSTVTEKFSVFDGNGDPAVRTDERNQTWRTTYDSVGNAIGLTDPRGTNAPRGAATEDVVATSSDPVAGLAYGTRRSVARKSGPAFTARWTYDGLDRKVVTAIPKRSAVTGAEDRFRLSATAYDLNDNPVKTTDSRGNITTTRFTPTDQVSAEISPGVTNRKTTSTDGDNTDDAPAEGDPVAQTTRYLYDEVDNLTRKSDPLGGSVYTPHHRTIWTYNPFDEPVAQTRYAASGGTSRIIDSRAYDARGNVIGEADGNRNGTASAETAAANAANTAKQRHQYVYDEFDRLKSDIENPAGTAGEKSAGRLETKYDYDAEDNLKTKTTPAGRTTRYEYDDRNELIKQDDPFKYSSGSGTDASMVATTTWKRRGDGLPYEMTAPRGNDGTPNGFVTKMSYWDTGELKKRSLPRQKDQYGADWEVAYEVNPVGDPIRVTDARLEDIKNDFLDTGELAKTDRPGWWIYDEDTRKVRERTDEDPRPSDKEASDLPSTTVGGDFGDVEAQKLPDVLPAAGETTLDYDDDLNLATATSWDDVYDPAEARKGDDSTQRIYRTEHTVAQKFEYDAISRLKSREIPLDGNSPITLRWQYDADDNTVAAIDGEKQATVYTYDDYDRLTQTSEPRNCGGNDCERQISKQDYDANDNITTETSPRKTDSGATAEGGTTGVTSHTYDVADREIRTVDDSGARTQREYDRDGFVLTETRPRAFTGLAETDEPAAAVKDKWTTTYTRDGAGRVTDEAKPVTGPGGSQTLHTTTKYDRNGNPTEVTSPGSASSVGGDVKDRVQKTSYDGRDLPYVTTVGSGDDASSTATEYDGNGWLRRTVKPKGMETKDGVTRPKVSDPQGTAIDPAKSTITKDAEVRLYTPDGLMTDRILPWDDSDAASGDKPQQRWRAKYEYSSRGLVKRITGIYNDKTGGGNPDHDTLIGYNRAAWPTSTTERDRNEGGEFPATPTDVLEYKYDKQGHQTLWASPNRTRQVRRAYFPSGKLRSKCGVRLNQGSTDARQDQVYSYRYNAAGDLSTVVDWMHHDPGKNDAGSKYCEEAVQPGDDDTMARRKTRIVNDKAGRQLTVDEQYSGGKDTSYSYVPNGGDLVQSVTTGGVIPDNGGAITGGTKTSYGYDELDRNSSVEAQDDGSSAKRQTDMTYWPSGDRRQMTKPATTSGKRTVEERAYDTRGLLTQRKQTAAAGAGDDAEQKKNNHAYTYDANGNRLKDERGENTYNARDQLIKWVRQRRDPSANPSAKDPEQTTEYTLDGEGRVRKQVDTVEALRVVLNAPQTKLQTVTTTDSSGPQDYKGERLIRQRIKSETKAAATGTGLSPVTTTKTKCSSYNIFGSLTETTATETADAGCPGQADGPAAKDPKTESRYVYDTFERLVAGETTSTQDSANSGSQKLNGSEAYCYDALDRRDRRVTGLKDSSASPNTDPGTASGEEALARARKACTTEPSAQSGDVKSLDMAYMGTSKRLTSEAKPKDGLQRYEYTSTGERIGRMRKPDANTAANWRNYETDAQGTVVGLEAPDTGKVAETDRYDTDPYGTPVDPNQNTKDSDAQENPFRFQGFYRDDTTGTYDMEARTYKPGLGQFLQQDRFADPDADLTLAKDPLTSSRYSFVAGNPATRGEYDGHAQVQHAPGDAVHSVGALAQAVGRSDGQGRQSSGRGRGSTTSATPSASTVFRAARTGFAAVSSVQTAIAPALPKIVGDFAHAVPNRVPLYKTNVTKILKTKLGDAAAFGDSALPKIGCYAAGGGENCRSINGRKLAETAVSAAIGNSNSDFALAVVSGGLTGTVRIANAGVDLLSATRTASDELQAAQAITRRGRLRANLIEAHGALPEGYEAHHIVAVGAKGAGPAREQLRRFGIDPNDIVNGVALPGRGSGRVAGSSYHPSVHTDRYYNAVNARIGAASNREEAIEVLDQIRGELSRGRFPR